MAVLSLGADSAQFNPVALFGRKAVEAGVERLIALLDQMDGDPDLEDAEPLETNGDELDLSWTEWHTRGSRKLDPGIWTRDGHELHEDAELNGDEEDCNRAEDEDCAIFRQPDFLRFLRGSGCDLADPGGDEHDGREQEYPLWTGDSELKGWLV